MADVIRQRKDGENIAKEYAANTGRSTLESTLHSQGIARPSATDALGWRQASASYALQSSGEAQALLGSEIGKVLPKGIEIGKTWSYTEKILLNISPRITGVAPLMNFGYSAQTVVNIPRVFQFGLLFSGLFSGSKTVINTVNERGNENYGDHFGWQRTY